MTLHRRRLLSFAPLFAATSMLLGALTYTTKGFAADSPESLILLDAESLDRTKKRVQSGDKSLTAAVNQLKREANKALKRGPYSVIHKPFVPPSGDKRDYMSVGPYWWPNPDTDDGLPYVRRDGQVNPQRHEYDSATLSRMVGDVSSLGLAYHFTGHEPYAKHAALLLRTWFLDEPTRMTPHLKYGQAVPGHNEGRYIGIIDTVRLLDLLDPVILLTASDSWSTDDHQRLQAWFGDYLTWLTESDFGKQESSHPNNHGTWFDTQVACFALFAGEPSQTQAVLERVPKQRIARHIKPDGSQPEELIRTLAFDYSCGNLRAMMLLATVGRHVDIDLWNFSTDDGRSIRTALEWLIPFTDDFDQFPHQQIRAPKFHTVGELLRRAGHAYQDDRYHELADRLLTENPAARVHLTLPR